MSLFSISDSMTSDIRRCCEEQYRSPIPMIPVVCVRGDRFSSAAPGGNMRVTCTDNSRVIKVSIVPRYEAERPSRRPMEVMVCFGVKYLKATHLASDLRCPFNPRARRNPACLLVSSTGLLKSIHDVSMPLASLEIVNPAAVPLWKNAHTARSSVKAALSALKVTFDGFTWHCRVKAGTGTFSVSKGIREL